MIRLHVHLFFNTSLLLTSVARDRLPIFRLDSLKKVTWDALNEARKSGSFLIFAYVIMLDHLHVIAAREKQPKVILQFINGLIARRVIDYLKEKQYESCLQKLRHAEYERRHQFSLWHRHPNTRSLTNEEIFMKRVNYTHQNPVRLGLVERAEDYRYSSARIWTGKPDEDEPLLMDIDKTNGGGAAAGEWS